MDCLDKMPSASRGYSSGDTSADELHHSSGVQALILKELKRVNNHLDIMEDTVGNLTHKEQQKQETHGW